MSGVFGVVRESIGKLGLLLLIAILSSPSLHAQLLRGGISGTTTDQQNAIVAGVRVIVTNQQTGVQQSTVTGDTGVYRLPAEPGIYTVEFRKDNFATQKAENVEVQAARDTTINAQLKIGTTATEVAVTINGMELDRVSPTVRLNLPGRTIDEIPMPTSSLVPAGSRNFARYALFTPGIARVLFQNETSANGHRGRENNYLIDGSDNNDQTVTLPALFVPPEAIQEVDVQAATFSAEYGRNIGAQINVITKRGTNSYRGQLWEFYRGNALEPLSLADWIAIRQRIPNISEEDARNPRLVDNQFGGAFGGPIVRNKTFFFGMAQANLLRTGPRPITSGVTIPTAAGYAALQLAPLRSGQSATSRQAALDALKFLPDVHSQINNYSATNTVQVNGTDVEMGRFNPVIPTRQNIWYSAIRVDHELSPSDHLTFRSQIDRRISPLSSGNLAFGERWGADNKYFAQNHFIGYTKNIGSNFINEARVSYSRLYPTVEERDPVTPTITLASNFQIGGNSNFPQDRLEQTWQVQNVSTYVISRHSLKFGLDLANTKLVSNNSPNAKGTWVFGTSAANSLQDFMNNVANRLDFLLGGATPLRYQFHQLRQAYFVQDDFKLTRTLTTNIGLRYETSSIPLGFFGATTTEVLNAMVPGPVQRDKNNWGPRVGFAYSPEFRSGLPGTLFGDGQSSIRGGFGVGYDVLFYSLLGFTANNYPRNDPQTLSLSGGNPPAVDQFPTLPSRVSSPTLGTGTAFVNVPSDAQNPTSNYWSLSIQRQINSNVTLEVGYNGNRSYHLIRQSQVNPPVLSAAQAASVIANCTSATLPGCQDPAPPRLNPSWGSRTTLETTGTASYNAAYLQINARTYFGLRLGANYTWSKNLSDSEEFSNDGAGASDGGLSGSSPQIPQDFFNRRNEWSESVFDRPHRATFNYSYEIPWFRSSPMALEKVFKGWQVSGFTELQSGQPFTIKIGVDAVGNGGAASARPNYNPGGILIPDPSTNNLRTFVIPLDGTGIVTAPHVTNPSTGAITFLRNSMPTGGNLGRNTFRGPGYASTNMSVMKRVSLPEDRQVQIRADFINVFNHDNFPNPDNNMNNALSATPTFGKQIYKPLTDARQVILGVKLAF